MTFNAPCLGASITPPPLLYNESLILFTKSRISQGDPSFMPAYYAAIGAANRALSSGPWSVMDCVHTPPSGDRHDYMSVSKYFWPCNNNPCNATTPKCQANGLPWLDCDGRTNSEAVNQYDLPRITSLSAAIQELAIGFLWTGNSTYAERVVFLWRRWFLDPATRMNPNGNFMQAVPGVNNGSTWGIIELSVFLPAMLDSISFIAPSGLWTPDDQSQTVSWLTAWIQWLLDSPLGRGESISDNNHQTYYDQMVVSAAIWTGNFSLAAHVLLSTLEPPPQGNPNAPIAVQIWRDGELPREEARTNSVGYVGMDLLGLLRLGVMSRLPLLAPLAVPDLLSYVARANMSSIRGAVDFMVPFVEGRERWPFSNIDNSSFAGFFEIYRRATHAGWDGDVYAAVAHALHPGVPTDTTQLFWPWPLL
jgi:hypothetical protein